MTGIHGDTPITVPPRSAFAETTDWAGAKVRAALLSWAGRSTTPNRLAAAIGTAIEVGIKGLPAVAEEMTALAMNQAYAVAQQQVTAAFPPETAQAVNAALGGFELMAALGVSPAEMLRQHLGEVNPEINGPLGA